MRIGLLGGTGKEGKGIASRWARAGHEVTIGSRDPERAKARAEELRAAGHGSIEGGDNRWAAERSEVVLLCVPYAAHEATLQSVKDVLPGRILIDITVPLRPPTVFEVHLPAGTSAALEAQAIVGPSVTVVATLHHISSVALADPSHAIEGEVLYCTDDQAARSVTETLLVDLGARPLDAGPLRNAVALESLTPVLLHIGKKYKARGAGIHITGLP